MLDGVLKKIIDQKAIEVEAAKKHLPLSTLKALCVEKDACKDFYVALASAKGAAIIAECKRKSPSKGVLIEDYDPISIAKTYEQGGAAAVSVLTDESFFGGSLEDLEGVSDQVAIPTLRKDFIIDEYQIYEAFRFGASSFLLLASVLDEMMLQYFTEVGRDLGMEPLIEVHTQDEMTKALKTDCKIIGINTRDLRTMTVDPNLGNKILEALDKGQCSTRLFVLESGVSESKQIKDGLGSGFKAFLIGEYLMKNADPKHALINLLQCRND